MPSVSVTAHDLSLGTSFIVAVLFLMVKASRPMTYQYLTVQLVKSIGENRIKKTKASSKQMKNISNIFGFDSLVFSKDILN